MSLRFDSFNYRPVLLLFYLLFPSHIGVKGSDLLQLVSFVLLVNFLLSLNHFMDLFEFFFPALLYLHTPGVPLLTVLHHFLDLFRPLSGLVYFTQDPMLLCGQELNSVGDQLHVIVLPLPLRLELPISCVRVVSPVQPFLRSFLRADHLRFIWVHSPLRGNVVTARAFG